MGKSKKSLRVINLNEFEGKEEKKEKKSSSEARKEFAKLIEVYKKQNPVKYEMKKEALEKKLKSL